MADPIPGAGAAAKDGLNAIQTLLVPGLGGAFGFLLADATMLEERIYEALTKKFTADELAANDRAKLKEVVFIASFVPFVVYLALAFGGLGYAWSKPNSLWSYPAGFVGGFGAGAAANKGWDILTGVME